MKNNNNKTLSMRMKEYESVTRNFLLKKTPVIIRIDGKAFHNYHKNFVIINSKHPFKLVLNNCLESAALETIKEIQGAKCFYLQSDEVSFLLTDFENINTDMWFNGNIQKISSVTTSLFTSNFIKECIKYDIEDFPTFDARVFNLPKKDVVNYFVWRQQDWFRNSISMLTRYYYNHKELYGKKQSDMHEMLYQKGINWADLNEVWKNGTFYDKTENNLYFTKIFKDQREDFNKWLYPEVVG